ncbi:acyltransferase family protein [Burkholderia gladioli]|uniref:acyltransferase family protein n=1 Tax=Burkholderia gladioli TaxID=28095 RepID=UPI001640E6B3|nr:acyltransferase [Burkholderia gladioli]MBU9169255.1 acyltransferase [Burkholderia gladioli]
MSLYNLGPYFVLLALLCLLYSLPAFKFLDAEASMPGRVSTIDGLRGFLALSVFAYHGLINYSYMVDGKWQAPGALFYRPLGGVAVMFFFMITAYLFWGRLLKQDGRPNWKSIYINRFFRIAPLYIATVIGLIIIVFWRTGFTIHEPARDLIEHCARWLAFGLDDSMPPINAFPWTVFILMGVTWSIKYEWWFYFSLVVLAIFVQLRMHLVFALVGLVASLAFAIGSSNDFAYLPAAFFCGIATASLLHEGFRPTLSPNAMSAIAAACMVVLFSFAKSHAGEVQIILIGATFYLICSGASMFGVLHLRSAERLGHISYGIYLIQGIPMTLLYWHPEFKAWAIRSTAHYWLSLLVCAVILCVVSSIAHVAIERPFISIGKRLSKRSRSGKRDNEARMPSTS